MQDSYWIALLGIIMVSLKTNSPNAEPIKTPDPGVPVSKKKWSFFQYSNILLMRCFFEETKMKEKNYTINMQLST